LLKLRLLCLFCCSTRTAGLRLLYPAGKEELNSGDERKENNRYQTIDDFIIIRLSAGFQCNTPEIISNGCAVAYATHEHIYGSTHLA
jgi:hypothetical protein